MSLILEEKLFVLQAPWLQSDSPTPDQSAGHVPAIEPLPNGVVSATHLRP